MDAGTASVIPKTSLQQQAVLSKPTFGYFKSLPLHLHSESFIMLNIAIFSPTRLFDFDKTDNTVSVCMHVIEVYPGMFQFCVVVVPPTLYLGANLALSESSGCSSACGRL